MAIPIIKICPIAKFIELIENDTFNNKAVIINTSYPADEEIQKLDSSLVLRYDDVDMPIINRSITEAHCTKAADFIISNRNREALYFCCDSGVSRSSAMAASAYRYFGLDDMDIWKNPHYSPNALVFDMMCQALKIPVKDYELDYRLAVSSKALSNAIRSKRLGNN